MYLNAHSYYSLRYGTLSIDELLDLAVLNGLESLCLTDVNTTMGIPEFVKKAGQKGIKPIAGCEFRKDDELLFIGLARNREGLKELNDWQTEHNLQKKTYPANAPEFKEVYVIYPFGKKKPKELRENEFTGIHPEQINSKTNFYWKNWRSTAWSIATEKTIRRLKTESPTSLKSLTVWDFQPIS